jgi:DNA-binding MarR family transcriptional regulator
MRVRNTLKIRPKMAELMLLVRLPNTVTALSEIQDVSRQTVAEWCKSCEQKGWITRIKRGRHIHLEITESGLKTISDFRALLG